MANAVGVDEGATRLFLVGLEFLEVGEVRTRERVGVPQHAHDVVVLHHGPEAAATVGLIRPVDWTFRSKLGEQFPRGAFVEDVKIRERLRSHWGLLIEIVWMRTI